MLLKYYDKRNYIKISYKAREYLSKPLGELYSGEEIHNIRDFIKDLLISKKNTCYIATVGDRVTKTLIDWGYTPDLAVIDCMERRRPVNLVKDENFSSIIFVDNRRGYINISITEIVEEALKHPPVLIKVGGEDDLVGIPVIFSLPEGSIMLYGQPKQGIVLVKVTSTLKFRLKEIIFSE